MKRENNQMMMVAVVIALVVVLIVSLRDSPHLTLATSSNVFSTIGTAGHVGLYSSLELDTSGYPVVSYFDTIDVNLKVLHCNDPDCSGQDESIVTVDATDNVGHDTSLALDANGYPVVSYYDKSNGDLKVLHCNDPDCSGQGESIVTVDAAGDVGQDTSLALDASGYPVVSYYDASNADLKVLHCNDPDCGGQDESIVTVDATGNVGQDTLLALDANGYPVVSYYDASNADLKVLHCNDADCSGQDESIVAADATDDVGQDTSLALDANGYPVVSYYDASNDNLKVLHCNDPDCSGQDESIIAADKAGPFGGTYTSLELDANGNPVISYLDSTGRINLKVLHCGDANCTSNDNVATALPGSLSGGFSSLTLDRSGKPVVSYGDIGWGYLVVLHCGDVNCIGPKPPTPTPTPCSDNDADTLCDAADPDDDDDGCTDDQEQGLNAALGGLRDKNNFWDFFDVWTGSTPVRDRAVGGGDIAAVVLHFGLTQDPPLAEDAALTEARTAPASQSVYHSSYDRGGSSGPNVWDLLPPDGAVGAGDIAAVVLQFGHTCA